MAISLKTAGSWARMVTDLGTVTIPGSPAAGDRMFLFGSWKDFSITVSVSGWTPIGAEFADGAVTAGNGTGSVKVAAWYRDWQSGDTAPAIDYSTAPTEGHWVIMLWQKGAGDTWATPATVTAAIASATDWTATASSTLDVSDGAVVMELVGFRDDSATMTRSATTALEDNGSPNVTWNGNYVESPATHFSSTTGLDMSGDLGHRFVTTGAVGVTLTGTGTLAAAETGAAKWVVQALAVAVTGTGAVAVPSGTVAGAGAEVFTASGAISVPAASVAGVGAEVFSATGAVTVPAGTVEGTGEHTQSAPDGSGAISVPAVTVEGVGQLLFTATGAISLPPATVAGLGSEVFTGTGAIAVRAAAVEGAGLHIEAVTGTGAITAPAPLVSGSGMGPAAGGRGYYRNLEPEPVAPEPVTEDAELLLLL